MATGSIGAFVRACWLVSIIAVWLFTTAANSQPTNSSTSDNDAKLLCMAEMVSNIGNSCSQPDVQGYRSALQDVLRQYLGRCFYNLTQNQAFYVMLPDISAAFSSYMGNKSQQYEQQAGTDVMLTIIDPGMVDAEVSFQLTHNLTYSHDAWLIKPESVGTIVGLHGFYNLTAAVGTSPSIDYADYLPFFKETSNMYYGEVVSLAVDGNMQLLYYRKDVFAQLGLPVPNSWDELVQVAQTAKAAGLDLDSDNSTEDYAFCMELRSDCNMATNMLMTILAPYLQYQGTSFGVYFDPQCIGNASKQPALVNNPAMEEALRIYQQLAALSPNVSSTSKCTDPWDTARLFASGRCLMAVGLGMHFKAANGSFARGKMGVAQAPGSYKVLERYSNQLQECTPFICRSYEIVNPLAGGSPKYLNRAPFAAEGGWAIAANGRSPSALFRQSLDFMLQLASAQSSWDLVLDANSEFDPYRTQHLQDAARWVAAGYHPQDTQQYLAALSSTFASQNIALDLRVPGTAMFKDLYQRAASSATLPGSNLTAIMESLDTAIMGLLCDPRKVDRALLAEVYRYSIQYSMPRAPPGVTPGSSTASKDLPSWLPLAIVFPTIALFMALAALAIYEVRNSRTHRDWRGHVRPPGPGKETTIVVTHIQDIDRLQEVLPEDVMEVSCKVYEDCVRRLLPKYHGYESMQGGDAFTLAFHCPKDALLFSLDLQCMLTTVDWPVALLEDPACAPLYVLNSASDVKVHDLEEILEASDTPRAPVHTTVLGSLLDWFTKSLLRRQVADRHMLTLLPSLKAVGINCTYTLASAAQAAWKPVSPGTPGAVLLFRGLGINIGLHSHAGVHQFWNGTRKAGRSQYTGEALSNAHALTQTAEGRGGVVLLSEGSYKQLPLEKLWERHLVLHAGEHKLNDQLPNFNVYHAMSRSMEGRLGFFMPLRTLAQQDPGVLDAPVGRVTISFMNVVGMQALLSWNAAVAQQALCVYQSLVRQELGRRKGYLVEAVDGLFLASFESPGSALAWALSSHDAMTLAVWPEELLAHELCEELVVSAPTKDGEVINTVVFRGLRLKTGVDTGQALGEMHAMTGRMAYRGKVMNRAARIASTAASGQVLCSAKTWELANQLDSPLVSAEALQGSSLGEHRLKGVAERMELIHCRRQAGRGHNAAHTRRSSMLCMPLQKSRSSNARRHSQLLLPSRACHVEAADGLPHAASETIRVLDPPPTLRRSASPHRQRDDNGAVMSLNVAV